MLLPSFFRRRTSHILFLGVLSLALFASAQELDRQRIRGQLEIERNCQTVENGQSIGVGCISTIKLYECGLSGDPCANSNCCAGFQCIERAQGFICESVCDDTGACTTGASCVGKGGTCREGINCCDGECNDNICGGGDNSLPACSPGQNCGSCGNNCQGLCTTPQGGWNIISVGEDGNPIAGLSDAAASLLSFVGLMPSPLIVLSPSLPAQLIVPPPPIQIPRPGPGSGWDDIWDMFRPKPPDNQPRCIPEPLNPLIPFDPGNCNPAQGNCPDSGRVLCVYDVTGNINGGAPLAPTCRTQSQYEQLRPSLCGDPLAPLPCFGNFISTGVAGTVQQTHLGAGWIVANQPSDGYATAAECQANCGYRSGLIAGGGSDPPFDMTPSPFDPTYTPPSASTGGGGGGAAGGGAGGGGPGGPTTPTGGPQTSSKPSTSRPSAPTSTGPGKPGSSSPTQTGPTANPPSLILDPSSEGTNSSGDAGSSPSAPSSDNPGSSASAASSASLGSNPSSASSTSQRSNPSSNASQGSTASASSGASGSAQSTASDDSASSAASDFFLSSSFSQFSFTSNFSFASNFSVGSEFFTSSFGSTVFFRFPPSFNYSLTPPTLASFLLTYIPGITPPPSIPALTCGNASLDADEECDDGSNNDGDGCSAYCLLERGYCGDGHIERLLGEQCEAGVENALGLECQPNCRFLLPFCGNAALNPGEECDVGNQNRNTPGALCRPDCSLARCGDRILDPNELCDDGNRLTGDGCNPWCQPERSVFAAGINTLPGNVINLPFAPMTPGTQPPPTIAPNLPNIPQTTSTGPETILIMAGGAAAGYAWIRRRRM